MSPNNAMPRIVIVGPPMAILPFLAAGVELLPAEDVATARGLLRTLGRELEKGVVFITDELAAACRDDIADIRHTRPTVAVLPLPPTAAAGREHHEWVRELVRRAVGMDLLGDQRR